MIRYSLSELDDLLPELPPGTVLYGLDGTAQASDVEVAEFLDRYTANEYPRALVRAVEGIDDTVERHGGNRHKSLRLFLRQVLAEAAVGAYPARQAVEQGYERWQRHIHDGQRAPQPYELRNLLRWEVPRVGIRDDLKEVRERLDDVFGELVFNSASTTSGASGHSAFVLALQVRSELQRWAWLGVCRSGN